MADSAASTGKWSIIPQSDLTPDFIKFINGLEEILVHPQYMTLPVRNFRVRGCSLNENMLGNYFNHVEKGLFQAKESDVFVVTFPKCGTTWAQEIIRLLSTDLDFETAKNVKLDDFFPFLEYITYPISKILDRPSPRFIKSHLPYALLPSSIWEKKCKIVYVARNPKDTIVSYYHFAKALGYFKFPGSFNDFFHYFINGLAPYSPYDSHVLEFWKRRNEENVLFLTYEDMKKDLLGQVKIIANFLGKPVSDEDAQRVASACDFKNMSKNPACNKKYLESSEFQEASTAFMRRGEIADWKNYFNDEINAEFDEWYKKSFVDFGLQFQFE